MTERYTVVFDPTLTNIDKALQSIELLDAAIESVQRFIGTAVVLATDEQVRDIQSLDTVVSVAPTGQVRAAENS